MEYLCPMLRWIIFIAIYLALGLYALQALKTVTRYPWVYYLFIAIALLVLGNFIYQFTLGEEEGRVLSKPKSYAFGLLLTVMAFQLITILFQDICARSKANQSPFPAEGFSGRPNFSFLTPAYPK